MAKTEELLNFMLKNSIEMIEKLDIIIHEKKEPMIEQELWNFRRAIKAFVAGIIIIQKKRHFEKEKHVKY